MLGLLDALFLAFVAVQARYFFGGTQRLALLELTYAEYARRGFFELLAVAGLVVPLLLARSTGCFGPKARPRYACSGRSPGR